MNREIKETCLKSWIGEWLQWLQIGELSRMFFNSSTVTILTGHGQ